MDQCCWCSLWVDDFFLGGSAETRAVQPTPRSRWRNSHPLFWKCGWGLFSNLTRIQNSYFEWPAEYRSNGTLVCSLVQSAASVDALDLIWAAQAPVVIKVSKVVVFATRGERHEVQISPVVMVSASNFALRSPQKYLLSTGTDFVRV